jgi:AraC family transcriptional regulator
MLVNASRMTLFAHRRFDLDISQAPTALQGVSCPSVEIHPADVVKRRVMTGNGIVAEIVQATRRETVEFRFCAPLHLLVICDRGLRSDGKTFVEGLAPSRLRDVRHKLTLVPAGHEYRDWQRPRVLARIAYFYFDPAWMPAPPAHVAASAMAPRLFFGDAALLDTALKLIRLMEHAPAGSAPYFDALSLVLAHELVRFNAGAAPVETRVCGGLATWQQCMVAAYIEEHLAERISVGTLARLVRLSRFHFCRAFKQSFGMPPHRYHTSRRIEQAKGLLGRPVWSVTHVGHEVGFSETSSFTAAFHKTTGLTPTAYRRSLA